MIRKHAVPLIRKYIAEHDWMMYVNPPMGLSYQIERPILKALEHRIPDIMDGMQAVAAFVDRTYRNCRLELVKVPMAQMAEMGQAEFFIMPERLPIYLTRVDDQFYVGANEFFPFD